MPTDTFCSDTFYVHTDPGSLSSFAEECNFGNCLRIHTTKNMCALGSSMTNNSHAFVGHERTAFNKPDKSLRASRAVALTACPQ